MTSKSKKPKNDYKAYQVEEPKRLRAWSKFVLAERKRLGVDK